MDLTPTVAAVVAILALVLTTPGATVAAGIVNRVVEYLKNWARTHDRVAGNERETAAIVSFLLVLVAYLVGLATVPPTQMLPWVQPLAFFIGLPLTWYNITRLSMSVADDIARTPNSIRPA